MLLQKRFPIFLLLNCLISQSFSIKVNSTHPVPIKTTKTKLGKTTTTIIPADNVSQSHNAKLENITILHEVHETPDEKPLELNLHEILTLKPVKKKSHNLDKPSGLSYEKRPARPLKDYDLHPVTFDFNLGDLEDLTHDGGSVKKSTELTSSEAKRLLSDDIPGVVTYADGEPDEENVSDGLNIQIAFDDANSTEATAATTTTTTSASSTHSTSSTVLTTISPHIFKILKNKPNKKERELLKHEDVPKRFSANMNSLNGQDDGAGNGSNATAAGLQHSANLFQIMTNLYDHFYWQASDIRVKVTTGCGLEMQAYLTALHENYEWAQRAYDSSGRYRGQLLYGNDKWLGEKNFCYEINRQLQPEERKHFEFQFFVAVIGIHTRIPYKIEMNLQIGECLPRACNAQDVNAILNLDPHSQMLLNLGQHQGGSSANQNSTTATNSTQIIVIKRVRPVPGAFNIWHDLKFQIFMSFMASLVLLVIIATSYQAKLNRCQLTTPIPAISAQIDASIRQNVDYQNSAKGFELYQMRTLSDNNNVIDPEADVNSNKTSNNMEIENRSSLQRQEQHQRQQGPRSNGDIEKATQSSSDYKVETNSSTGAGGTCEARKQLALHEQLLLCFAFQTNCSTILNIDDVRESQTACIHGLRVLSVLWTIMVHTYLQMFNIGENRYRRIISERSFLYQFIGNATFSVDTFFFISGFLVTLLFLRQRKKYPEDTGQFVRRSCIDIFVLFIYRYIRLTPAYLFVIFFNDFALRQTSDDSVFQPTVATTTCSQFWWRNILYINNFYPLNEICMIWSWYMANDMQFFLMASILLLLSTRYLKTAALIVSTFLLTSWALSGVISLQHHYTHKVSSPFESFDFLYDKPWQRVGTYIVGMLTGYLIHKMKTPPRISHHVNRFLWLCSLGLLILVTFGVWQGELSEISTAFYVSVGHTAFGVGLVWIVLSCCWGLSPTWNRVLSYRCFWPLSRLTYCTYLIHPVIMLITSFIMAGTVHLGHLFVLTIFLGNTVVSFCVAFFISVLLEAPVIRLLKIFFGKRQH